MSHFGTMLSQSTIFCVALLSPSLFGLLLKNQSKHKFQGSTGPPTHPPPTPNTASSFLLSLTSIKIRVELSLANSKALFRQGTVQGSARDSNLSKIVLPGPPWTDVILCLAHGCLIPGPEIRPGLPFSSHGLWCWLAFTQMKACCFLLLTEVIKWPSSAEFTCLQRVWSGGKGQEHS